MQSPCGHSAVQLAGHSHWPLSQMKCGGELPPHAEKKPERNTARPSDRIFPSVRAGTSTGLNTTPGARPPTPESRGSVESEPVAPEWPEAQGALQVKGSNVATVPSEMSNCAVWVPSVVGSQKS
jgi:hypothetical protein